MAFDAFTIDVLLKLGAAGANQPIVGGALVFLVAGIGIGYLTFVRDEFEAGIVMKVGTIALFVMAILAYYWPQRPWPH
ncbi:MAG: hypothetical protein ABEJ89_09765 [Haloarculaceae archaeon]